MQDAKEDVRSRLNIEDVIGDYVQLKRAGRNFKGLSPFTAEKSPSFVVSPDKHIWHDFSSNKGGDVFGFIMEVEGVDFRTSLEILARRAGVDLSLYESQGGQELANRKKRLFEANNLAADYYQHSLLKNSHAIDYVFKKRGLSKEIVQAFRIGYAPTQGDGLTSFLVRKGFTNAQIKDAGLANQYGGDLFRGRMMVPLMDVSGRVIGFTGRILQDDPKAPKYLNTPQTLLYDKSRNVFGLSQAKESIRNNDYAVIVEGNLDVVSSHQVDVKQVVATAGTAMTEYHLRALARLSGNVKLAFDGDKAGLAATERAIPIASSVGAELSIISLPDEYKDPDELIQADVKLWIKAIDDAEPAVDWVIKQYAKRVDLASAAGKRLFSSSALAVIDRLSDPVEKDHYFGLVARMIGTPVEALRAKLAQATHDDETPHLKPVKSVISTDSSGRDQFTYQDDLLAAALVDGGAHDLFRNIDTSMFEGDDRRAVANYLKNSGGKAVKDTPPELLEFDTYVKILLLRAESRYADFQGLILISEVAELLRRIETEYKKKQKEQLQIKLQDAEVQNDDDLRMSLLKQIYILDKEINSARR